MRRVRTRSKPYLPVCRICVWKKLYDEVNDNEAVIALDRPAKLAEARALKASIEKEVEGSGLWKSTENLDSKREALATGVS